MSVCETAIVNKCSKTIIVNRQSEWLTIGFNFNLGIDPFEHM